MRAGRKKEFTDPSIATAALGASPQRLLAALQTFGFVFETLCIRDLRVYTSAMGGKLSYYRDRYGLESDCVLHLHDGRFALIEFKLGNKQIEEGAAHLVQIRDLIRKANTGKSGVRVEEPSLMMVVTGGSLAYTRKDGVHVVPIGCMKP
jgi:predicted AAA+ superfamily ATPase